MLRQKPNRFAFYWRRSVQLGAALRAVAPDSRIARMEMRVISRTITRFASSSSFARYLGSAFAMIAVALPCEPCGHSPTVLLAFRTDQQAQELCPGDTVVWPTPRAEPIISRRMGHMAGRAQAPMSAVAKRTAWGCTRAPALTRVVDAMKGCSADRVHSRPPCLLKGVPVPIAPRPA
jgi:hypothetical protein